MRLILLFCVLVFFAFEISINTNSVNAQSPSPSLVPDSALTPTPSPAPQSSPPSQQLKQKDDEIKELEKKVSELRGKSTTLLSEISVMDNQIKLTQLRINATKQELSELIVDIETATKKILTLEESLHKVTKILVSRVVATYEIASMQPIQVLLSSNNISDYLKRASYLRVVQAHDKRLLYDMQQAKNDYANQKEIYEGKKRKVESLKQQLEGYTVELDTQKKSKQSLLDVTRNDEKRYQNLLARARAEFEAIQGIVAGNGQETEAGVVPEGKVIASVIVGPSCNSSGEHLHFIVSRNGNTENPFNYLQGGIDFENCTGSSCGSSDGDPFNPAGNWNWPIQPKIRYYQGYGQTWAVRYTYVGRIYNFHNGIDIDGSSLDVKAVKEGVLYQGSYAGSGGCRLRYVRVHQNDSGLDTFYLHVNYVL